ncbi:MAG: N-acetylglucosamine-6-phosphate deacetylase, partial [Candidatus Poribacteria bacterium]|nr:N-acetylglucosamine-6-phosphate deacetylase [Candidatus Poribacteria bacterium]
MQRLGVDLGGLRIRLTDDGSVFTEIAPSSHASDVLLAPPLVDIQLNGFGGIDINSPDVQPDDLLNMLEKVWAGGVGFFLPTVVTGSRERMLRSIRMVREACRQDARFARSVVGIHVEGPYISLEDGPRGAHPLQHVRQPDMDEYRAWQEAADGTVRLVTLSPEWDNAPPFIEHIVNDDVRIAIGHTKATSEQLDAAVRAGATLSTHLGNGAHAMIQRHPNYIWEQLGDDRLWASLIADTHHLPPRTLKSMVRGKTLDRTIFTSDAVWVAGLPAGQYGGFDGKGLEVLE